MTQVSTPIINLDQAADLVLRQLEIHLGRSKNSATFMKPYVNARFRDFLLQLKYKKTWKRLVSEGDEGYFKIAAFFKEAPFLDPNLNERRDRALKEQDTKFFAEFTEMLNSSPDLNKKLYKDHSLQKKMFLIFELGDTNFPERVTPIPGADGTQT